MSGNNGAAPCSAPVWRHRASYTSPRLAPRRMICASRTAVAVTGLEPEPIPDGAASRCLPAAGPGVLAAGHRAHSRRSRPGSPWPGSSEFRLSAGLSKVSGANETGGAKREPTSTGVRPRQATSSHSRGWQMPHRATSSHVQRRYELVLQARGRRFEPCCAHCFSRPEACRNP
jgi:hypothetical protein